MTTDDTTSNSSEEDKANIRGSGINHGSERADIVPSDAPSTARQEAENNQPSGSGANTENAHDLNAKILALIQENHLQLNLPLLVPNPQELRELQHVAPELYQEYSRYQAHSKTRALCTFSAVCRKAQIGANNTRPHQ